MAVRIAIYLRLSQEDDDLKESAKAESESISNQRKLLHSFIASQKGFAGGEIAEFCDDGWSGKNFERPGFKEMMEQIKGGQVQCVIVKDFSRFGRDYLIVGNYISRVFPFLGVRFISVNDSFDSANPRDIDSLDTAFKTLIYDLYSRELSQKVRDAKRSRAERGLFISAFAPYGYKKDPEDKNRLLIDEEPAAVIRQIFQMTAEGSTSVEIAKLLNQRKVPTPMLYKRSVGCSRERWLSIHEDNFWTSKSIYGILRDERYIGKSIYGKRKCDKVGYSHTVKVSPSDWVVVGDAHEAIIPKELFDRVQAKMRNTPNGGIPQQSGNILRRKVICGICGHAMSLTRFQKGAYACQTVGLGTDYDCSAEKIQKADVEDSVAALIRTYAQLAVDLERLSEESRKQHRADRKQMQRALAVLRSQKSQQEQLLQTLYEQLIGGSISRETYLSQKQSVNAQLQELSERITALEKATQSLPVKESEFIAKYKAYTDLPTLTEDIVADLLHSVVIYPNHKMIINLNYRDELESLLTEVEQTPNAQ